MATYSFSCALASSDIFSKSCELRRGLIARASSSSNISDPSGNSTFGCSRGTMIVPEDLRDTILGRCSEAVLSSCTEDVVEEVAGGGEVCSEGNGCVGGEAMIYVCEEWEGRSVQEVFVGCDPTRPLVM